MQTEEKQKQTKRIYGIFSWIDLIMSLALNLAVCIAIPGGFGWLQFILACSAALSAAAFIVERFWRRGG